MSSRAEAQIEVLEVNEDGYLVRWTFGDTYIDSSPSIFLRPHEQMLAEVTANMTSGLSIETQVDHIGVITEVTNWPEMPLTIKPSIGVVKPSSNTLQSARDGGLVVDENGATCLDKPTP